MRGKTETRYGQTVHHALPLPLLRTSIRSHRPDALKPSAVHSLREGNGAYHWESLSSGCCGTSEHHGLILPEAFLEYMKDDFIVLHGIQVMNTSWVRAIMEFYVRVGNPFSKVRLPELRMNYITFSMKEMTQP